MNYHHTPVSYPPGSCMTSDGSASTPRVELPSFEGSNPKLWQRRCEEYFQRWGTHEALWITYSTNQFTGVATTWLEAYPNKFPKSTWSEFVKAVQARFMRNQHQILLRRLYHIQQTGSVEDYVQRFSDLIDIISAYGSSSHPLLYLTRLLDGLKPVVRVLVAIQQPDDLDTACSLALLYEELADGMDPIPARQNFSSSGRRPQILSSQSTYVSTVQAPLPPHRPPNGC